MRTRDSSGPSLAKRAAYRGLLDGVRALLAEARRTSVRLVNLILIATYWEIGRRIVEYEQRGRRWALWTSTAVT